MQSKENFSCIQNRKHKSGTNKIQSSRFQKIDHLVSKKYPGGIENLRDIF